MMIQWMSSQLLAGRTNLPSKVPPASREIVSPHLGGVEGSLQTVAPFQEVGGTGSRSVGQRALHVDAR